MKPAREWATLTGRTPIQTATVPTSSQKWQPSIIMILMPFKLFSWQTGVGNKGKWGDAICSINSVLNLCTICQFDEAVVEYFILGMCQVDWKQCDLELEIKFRRTRWTVSTPSSMAWESRTEWRDLSSRAGWTRTSSTTSRARCGRWGTCTVQTMLCSLTQEPRGEVFIQLEGFQS